MKHPASAIFLLFASAAILSGCGDEDRLRQQLATANERIASVTGKIEQCRSSAQSKYDLGIKATLLITDKGSATYTAAEATVAAGRNYLFWECMS